MAQKERKKMHCIYIFSFSTTTLKTVQYKMYFLLDGEPMSSHP